MIYVVNEEFKLRLKKDALNFNAHNYIYFKTAKFSSNLYEIFDLDKSKNSV